MVELKHFVRIANTDLEGRKPIHQALRKIKGVNVMFANAVCSVLNMDKTKKAGSLTEAEAKKIDEVLRNPQKFNIPSWMLNRRKDYETGEDKHVLIGDLQFSKESDIKRLKKIRSYRGIRHAMGLPLRGQRTKGNFRKGRSLGVARRKVKSGRV